MQIKGLRTFLVDPGMHKRWLFVTEYFVNFEAVGQAIAQPRHPYRERPLRRLRRPEDE